MSNYKSVTYSIIVNFWSMEEINLINVFHAENVSTDDIDIMKKVLKKKFPKSEDFELLIIKHESDISTIAI